MDKLRIQGPSRLSGSVQVSGAKNAALPALTAALLTGQPVTFERVPLVRDIATMRALLQHLGVESKSSGSRLTLHCCESPAVDDAPYKLVKTMRASVLVLGPLVARLGHARVSLPGGCAIGVRPIDQHLAALEALGATVELEHGYVSVTAKRLRGTRFRFAVETVGGTENTLLAACLADGESTFENCAQEPEIENLANILNAMGAKIEGAGSSTIRVQGVDQLSGCHQTIIGDRIEAGTYLAGAVATSGDVTVLGASPDHLRPLLNTLEECGARIDSNESMIRVRADGGLSPANIQTAPHPGFPTDLQAQFMALATQLHGVSRVYEAVFENRFQHVPELSRMGADIRIEGSLAVVHGPTTLSGAKVMATDLRASASLVLAAIAADGESIVDRIYHLDRGYESIEDKLTELGASVERISG